MVRKGGGMGFILPSAALSQPEHFYPQFKRKLGPRAFLPVTGNQGLTHEPTRLAEASMAEELAGHSDK